jgi:hydroxymethylpyrimidine/phosphomethylpyrimidine kinase
MKRYPSVLTIAGSDSGGGAGIQADIKTISALGCYATSAITAVTVQNTLGVTAIHTIPAAIVQGQITAVMNDVQPMAVKTGMIPDKELVRTIAAALRTYPGIPLIIDPVMIASSGHALVKEEMITAMQQELFPLAVLVTPNLDEAAVLAGFPVRDVQEMKRAAKQILSLGCQAVLVKGGHLKSNQVYDVYLDITGQEQVLQAPYITSHNLHGTGCTLSAAIASLVARGNSLVTAVALAKQYISQAIEAGREAVTGQGHGPLNHFFQPQVLTAQDIN